MDFQELKDIIQKEGGKVIIVENDKPQLVVMSFEEYKKKRQVVSSVQDEPAQRIAEREIDRESEMDGLTIDDLPLS